MPAHRERAKTLSAEMIDKYIIVSLSFRYFAKKNLIRECGVLDSLSETAQKVLANLITLFLGITIATKMQAKYFQTSP